jgi:abequosyltransferase
MIRTLISICIATYNRAEFISETIESIIPQMDADVELLIVDGASTDNTEGIVRKYVLNEPRIRYVRLLEKGGVDHDYDKSVELANGEFCWLFTDDDLIKPGAVTAVKNAINEGHDFIVVNAEVRNRDLSMVLDERRIVMRSNHEYTSHEVEELFKDTLRYLSFIGAVVIRRSIWMSRDRKKYYGTDFIHVGVIFQKSLPGTSYIIAEPYIIIRYGNAQWTSRRFEIWMFKWPELVWSFDYISDAVKNTVCKRKPWLNIKTFIFQRSLGAYNIEVYKRYFSKATINVVWKLFALAIALFPRKIIVAFHYIYSSIKSRSAREFLLSHLGK